MPSPPHFVHGCNYPWSTDGKTVFYGLDFGGNVWGSHLGVSTRRAAVERDFAAMAQLGFTVARWFVFCDGRSGIVFDDGGVPVGLDSHFFSDLDTALEVARGVDMALCLVLLDHRWMFRGLTDVMTDATSGTLLQASLPEGRARVLLNPSSQDRLFDRVLAPIVLRYGSEGVRADLAPAVFAYELINEPDFIIEEWEQDLSRSVPLPIRFATLGSLVTRLSELVHRHSSAMTTMAAARLRNLWAWDDDALGLDFLQVHSYPDQLHPLSDEDIFGREARSLGCSRPVILGEFPGNGPVRHPPWASPPEWTLGDYLDFAVRAGFAGAWPWSFSGTDDYGPLPGAPLQAFARARRQIVNVRSDSDGDWTGQSERS
ncbi:MAG: hypothetical protein ABL986_08595 [Vicinamibacterales bacterium]